MVGGLEFPDELSWDEIGNAALAVMAGQSPKGPFRSFGFDSAGATCVVGLGSDRPVAGERHLVEIDCSDPGGPTVVLISSGTGDEAPVADRPLVEAECVPGTPTYAFVNLRGDVELVRRADGHEVRRAGDADTVVVVSDSAPFVVEAISHEGQRLGTLLVAVDR